ncbi:MAG: DUF3298 domain-containing protein [Ferruginibacter sp.]
MKLFASGLFFSVVVFSIFSCGNKKDGSDTITPIIDTNVLLVSDSNKVLPLEYYKRFEGTIAGQQVYLQMSSLSDKISGIYYYESIGTPLYFSAQVISGDSLLLSEQSLAGKYFENERPATMSLKLSDSLLSGIWQSADRIRSFPVMLTESYPDGSFKFSITSVKDSSKPFPNMEDGPIARVKITSVVPDSNIVKENADFLKSEIAALLGYDKISSNNSVNDVAHKYINDYFFRYNKEFSLPLDTSINFKSTTFKYEYDQKIGVVYNMNNLVIFSSYTFDYTGGAHPNHNTTFFCVDVKNKKRLVLADVLIMDSSKIAPILEKIIRKERKIATSEKLNSILFENYILPNDNFYFNDMGIVFFYNPYEIAPYVYGDTELFVPFTALAPFLKPTFKERMKIK